ncbi:HAD-IA family hydrolase [Streptomyces sp. ACA25]|uniref:HAD-IA family hydrolase n=1 Tax=Streptomyces sp. ACA25 TaxID=3022596 RepID=UPI003FA6E819
MEQIVYSHEIGVSKPDLRAFEAACASLEAHPENCLFIDDVPANIEAARVAGMQGYLFGDNARTITRIAAHLDAGPRVPGRGPRTFRGERAAAAGSYRPKTDDGGGRGVRHPRNLWRQELGEVPDSVWREAELRVLILRTTDSRPSRHGQLHRLTTLNLAHNAVTSIPDALGKLAELSNCSCLHDNQLSRIPEAEGKLTRLGQMG